MEQTKTKKVTVGAISTKREGVGTYLKVSKDNLSTLQQALDLAKKSNTDFYLNVEFFGNSLKSAAKSGKLEVSRTEKQQERVISVETKAPGILADVVVTLPV